MNEDKITPAVASRNDLPNEMSGEEFQRKLYSWFEDRGLLSDLRAHLRTQMISVFKDTGERRIVASSTISPKLQALNLLIAEFLLQQDYHYSLSVFSAEVPLTNVLPEFPSHSFNKSHYLKKWRFSDKDMWDILETLGIQQYSDEAQNIFNVYYNGTGNNSLLTCIMRMLNSLQSRPVLNTDANQLIKSASANWRKDIYEALSSQNMNTQNINKILTILSEMIDGEHARLKSETREEHLKLEHELQTHFQTILKARNERLAELQKSLDFELSKNEEMAKNYERQQVQHRDRLRKLIVREQNVSKREIEIKDKDAFIKAQEYLIKTKMDSLHQEQRSLTVLQEKLESELRLNKNTVKNDVKLYKDLENECQNIKSQIVDTKEIFSNKLQESETEQEQTQILISQLKTENDTLKAVNVDQQQHIRELSQRATLLVHELEDTQNAFHNLQAHRHGIITAPPLASPVFVNRSISGGGGEEGSIRHSQRVYRQTSALLNASESNRRRSALRQLTVHSSSSSEDLSPTNELLREARQRLRRLEQESNEIDRNYRLYQSTLSNNFQAFSAALTAPSTVVPPCNFSKPFSTAANLFAASVDNKTINEDRSESKEPKQSAASSDVWDGVGTSGISFSGPPTSDEKSNSVQEDDDAS